MIVRQSMINYHKLAVISAAIIDHWSRQNAHTNTTPRIKYNTKNKIVYPKFQYSALIVDVFINQQLS